MLRPVLLVALLVVLLAPSAPQAAQAPAVRVVRAPEGAIQPRVARDAEGGIHLVTYSGEALGGELWYARSSDGGRTFGERLALTTPETRACAHGAVRGAQLALGRGGRVHVAWNGAASKAPHGAAFWYTRLDDSGTRFEPPRDVVAEHHGLDGGGALVADPAGPVWVAWHAPETPGGGEAARRVFVARSDDDGRTFGPESAASPQGSGVCPCCGIAAFVVGDALGLVYRTARDGEKRDTLFCSTGPGSAGYQQLDRWKSAACVMSTFAVASSPKGTLVAFESQGAVRFARPGLGAPPPPSTTAPGDSTARKHPSIACNDAGQVLLAWIAGGNAQAGGVLEWQLFGADGQPLADGSGRREDVPVWDLPATLALADGSFLLLY